MSHSRLTDTTFTLGRWRSAIVHEVGVKVFQIMTLKRLLHNSVTKLSFHYSTVYSKWLQAHNLQHCSRSIKSLNPSTICTSPTEWLDCGCLRKQTVHRQWLQLVTFTYLQICLTIIREGCLEMPDLRSTLLHCLSGLQIGMSEITQAHIAITSGTVRDRCQTFEVRISEHEYEQDEVYIRRAVQNMKGLVGQNCSYAGILRLAENATLSELPQELISFLRDHDNLYRAAIRNRSLARKARASPDMDVVEQVTHRVHNIVTAYYVNFVETSGSEVELQRMMDDPIFTSEFAECTLLLQNEIVHQLMRLDVLSPHPSKELELENIGPDHNIDDFGHDLPLPSSSTSSDPLDPSHRCCICLSPWTTTHLPFRITACAHTIGKPCLTRWLNSTARNANLCPCCRTVLCKRRPRKPTAMPAGEHERISNRVGRAIITLGQLERTQFELFGEERAMKFMEKAVERLNWRLFEGDVGFVVQCDVVRRQWGLRRVRWHQD